MPEKTNYCKIENKISFQRLVVVRLSTINFVFYLNVKNVLAMCRLDTG